MPSAPRAPGPGPDNRLLAALPPAEADRLRGLTDEISLELRDEVYRPGGPVRYVYFPRTGVFSLVVVLEDGRSVEVGTVGNEGMVGLPAFFGSDRSHTEVMCQIAPCTARRMPADVFNQESARPGPFRDLLGRYAQVVFNQVAQSVACAHMHPIEERCARWLLSTRDRVGGNEFYLSQEFLAMMLGVRRPSVTMAAGSLQSAGLIRYRHGNVVIVDGPMLEESACECYRIIRDDTERLLAG